MKSQTQMQKGGSGGEKLQVLGDFAATSQLLRNIFFPARQEAEKKKTVVHPHVRESPPSPPSLRGVSPAGRWRQRFCHGDVEDGADAQKEASEYGPQLRDQVKLHHLAKVGVVAGGVWLELHRRKQVRKKEIRCKPLAGDCCCYRFCSCYCCHCFRY